MLRKLCSLLCILVVMGLLVACEINQPVESHEVGLILDDGASVSEVVGPGRHDTWHYFGEIVVIDGSAKTLTWSNDEKMVTFDKQPIQMELIVTYARSLTETNPVDMYSSYHTEATDDAALALQVGSRIREVAKGTSTGYTLDNMLGLVPDSSREGMSDTIFKELAPELLEIHVVLLDVRITNIDVSNEYMAALEAKAQADIDIEVSQGQTALLQEQLNQEKARTEIAVEKARSDFLVAEQEARIYENPLYLDLERLRIQYGAFGKGDVVFIPQGTNVTYIMNNDPDENPSSYSTGTSPDNQ